MAEYIHVKVAIEDRVGILTIDNPPANALSRATVSDIDAGLDELLASERVKVIVITGAGNFAFVAGADIKEFPDLVTSEDARVFLLRGHAVLSKIEDSPKPVIAAINGLALGGGMELALACHMRIMSDKTRVGQPEIKLGLIPGWGGTQRLPRLIGLGRALEWILTGDMYDAQEAYRLGLATKLCPRRTCLGKL
jgi:enoyl-CoA hydratase/carnithine racemase